MSEMREIEVLEELAAVLDALGIPYAIGGYIASSMYGTCNCFACSLHNLLIPLISSSRDRPGLTGCSNWA